MNRNRILADPEKFETKKYLLEGKKIHKKKLREHKQSILRAKYGFDHSIICR